MSESLVAALLTNECTLRDADGKRVAVTIEGTAGKWSTLHTLSWEYSQNVDFPMVEQNLGIVNSFTIEDLVRTPVTGIWEHTGKRAEGKVHAIEVRRGDYPRLMLRSVPRFQLFTRDTIVLHAARPHKLKIRKKKQRALDFRPGRAL